MLLFVVAVLPLLVPPSMFFDDELMLVLLAWFANLSFPEIPGSSQCVLVLFTDCGCSEAVSDETVGPGLAWSSGLLLVLVSCQEQDAHLYHYLGDDLIPSHLRVSTSEIQKQVLGSVCLVTEIIEVIEGRRTSSYEGREGEQ